MHVIAFVLGNYATPYHTISCPKSACLSGCKMMWCDMIAHNSCYQHPAVLTKRVVTLDFKRNPFFSLSLLFSNKFNMKFYVCTYVCMYVCMYGIINSLLQHAGITKSYSYVLCHKWNPFQMLTNSCNNSFV